MARVLETIDARQSTRDAAREAVADRLGDVRKRLKRAQKSGGRDARSIHKLRTSCRRASAALDAFAPCLPTKRAEKTQKLLKKMRKAAGDLRDLDVQRALWARLGEEEPGVADAASAMIERTDKKRKKARKVFRVEISGFEPRRVKKAEKKLRKKASHAHKDGRGAERMGVFAQESLGAICGDLRRHVAAGPLGPEGLHDARIAEKRIRYAVEIFDRCLDAGIAAQLREDLKSLHDGLGVQNDLFEARGLLVKLGEKGKVPAEVTDPLRRVVDDRLIDAHREAEARLASFAERWLDERLETADFFVERVPAGS